MIIIMDEPLAVASILNTVWYADNYFKEICEIVISDIYIYMLYISLYLISNYEIKIQFLYLLYDE